MRTIFIVLAVPGYVPIGAAYNLPLNQRVEEAIRIALLYLEQQGATDVGSPEEYALRDIYSEELQSDLLVRHVPFPGVVIAVGRGGAARVGDEVVEGDEAVSAASRTLGMKLLAQREDDDDRLLTKYTRFVRTGAWRFEPTPITEYDVGLTCGADSAAQARQLIDTLEGRGLRCRARVAAADGTSSGIEAGVTPAHGARALVVLIDDRSRDEPWLAYDAGAAWAAGIPVVPVLVGAATIEPPDILAPYQRLTWDASHDRLVGELVEMLDLTPWSAVRDAEEAPPPPEPPAAKPRTRGARKRKSAGS